MPLKRNTEALLYFLLILGVGSLGTWKGDTKNGKLRGSKQAGNLPAEKELKFIRKSRSGIEI